MLHQDIRTAKSDKVSVVLYYEALCGGCHDWITTELVSTYEKLGKYMDFEFVPYGNAHVSLLSNDHVLDLMNIMSHIFLIMSHNH